MKISFFFMACALFLFSCKKEDPPLFTIPVQNLTFTVNPSLQPPYTYYIPINDVSINALDILAARGMDTSEITGIRPHLATLSVVFANSDLDFLDAVSVRLCSIGDNKENCGREVFYRDPVPFKPGFELELVPSNVNDVRELVLLENVNVQVKLERLRNFPEQTFDIRLDMEFGVW